MVERPRDEIKVRVTLLAVDVSALAGRSTQLRNTTPVDVLAAQPGGALPRPRRVVVAGFAPDWTQVRLDRGVGPRPQREVEGPDTGAQRAAIADALRSAVSDTLVGDLSLMGLAAERARPGDAPRPGDLVVAGEIESVDEGTRTRRLALGSGAGVGQVCAAVRVHLVGPDLTPRLLQTYGVASGSGRGSGSVLGGVGAPAQASAVPLAVSSALGIGGEAGTAGVVGEGQRLARRVAQELGRFFAAQGWGEPDRTPPRRRDAGDGPVPAA